MRTVNITFQASKELNVPWNKTPIVFVLKEVRSDFNVTPICDAISAVLGNVCVRTARLFLNEELTPEQACRNNGGYYISKYEPIKEKVNEQPELNSKDCLGLS